MNEILECIKKRRSIRAYEEKQIKDEELKLIIESGLYAPSAKNGQPWHFTVVQNKELLDELNVNSKEAAKSSPMEFQRKLANNPNFNIFYGAPTAIYVSKEDNAIESQVDISAAIENMLIAAESLGIGSCWLRFPSLLFKGPMKDEYINKLQIPDGFTPEFVISLGYKKQEVQQAPPRRENTVNYIK